MSLIQDAVVARAAATFFDRVADQLEATAKLSAAWSVTLGQFNGTSFEPASQPWAAQLTGDGQARVDIGDGYFLEFNEASSQIKIHNENTGEVTNIWGDPHVDWNQDGKTDVDFWGTTTFQLDNGTKITIDTEPWNGNENAYVASKVTITKGDNAVIVDGVSQNELGDLTVTQSNQGQLVDLATDDGFTVLENPFGEGWLNSDTFMPATQEDFNVTKPGAASDLPAFDSSLGLAITNFLLMGLVTGMFEALESSAAETGQTRETSPLLQVFRPDL